MKQKTKKMNQRKKNYQSKERNPIFVGLPMSRKLVCAALGCLVFASSNLKAQITTGQITGAELSGELNAVSTMVPFLTISPYSRSAAMGDV